MKYRDLKLMEEELQRTESELRKLEEKVGILKLDPLRNALAGLREAIDKVLDG